MTRRFLFFALLPVLPVLLALEAGAASLQFSSPNGEAVPMDRTRYRGAARTGGRSSLRASPSLRCRPLPKECCNSEGVEVAAYDYLSREALGTLRFSCPLRRRPPHTLPCCQTRRAGAIPCLSDCQRQADGSDEQNHSGRPLCMGPGRAPLLRSGDFPPRRL